METSSGRLLLTFISSLLLPDPSAKVPASCSGSEFLPVFEVVLLFERWMEISGGLDLIRSISIVSDMLASLKTEWILEIGSPHRRAQQSRDGDSVDGRKVEDM
jgi:hypothetical protein